MKRSTLDRLTGGRATAMAVVAAALVAEFVVAGAVAANRAAAVPGDAPSITEFPIAGSANPDQIAPGLPTDPGASVWVTDPYGGPAPYSGQIFRVDATGGLSGTFVPAAEASVPNFITRGPDGRMWTADFDGTLMRAGGDGVFAKVGPNGYAHNGLAVGPDGNVWYVSITGGTNTGQVGFIDPTTLAASDFDIPTADSHPEEITPGPPSDPNSMWFTEQSADRIGRVDTITHQVTDYGGLSAGARPNGIVVGSDGALWFAEYGVGKIGRIEPITHQVTEYGAPGELDGPDRMTVAPGGRIWFTLFNASKIGSFIPGPNPTFDLIPTPSPSAQPSGITVGPDGHVWFAEYNNHAVARIDRSYSQLPTTTVDSGPPATTTATTVTFTFHSSDPGATFQCGLDSAPFMACSSPHTISGLIAGQHTFSVRAVNGAGVDPKPADQVFTVTAAVPGGPPVNTSSPAIVNYWQCGTVISVEGRSDCTVAPHAYRCDPGSWEGTDPSVDYSFEWQRLTPVYLQGKLAYYKTTTEATGDTYYAEESGLRAVAVSESWLFQCVVSATGPGGTSEATSPMRELDPAPAPSLNQPWGNFRVKGIDVFQVVQPNTNAAAWDYPTGASFPVSCGGGTPTNWAAVSFGCALGGRPAQSAPYEGVVLDPDKPTTAFVYVDMGDRPPADPYQALQVTLSALVDGVPLPASEQIPPQTYYLPRLGTTPWVTPSERQQSGIAFTVPSLWLWKAARARLDLRATVAFKPTFGPRPYQCAANEAACVADDRFTVTGLQVDTLLPAIAKLQVQSVELRIASDTWSSTPAQVLQRAQQLFPGGEDWVVSSAGKFININDIAVDWTINTPFCAPWKSKGDLSGCQIAAIFNRLLQFEKDNPGVSPLGARTRDLLVAIDGPFGCCSTDTTKDGSLENPLSGIQPISVIANTATSQYLFTAAHELGHAFGLPHAGQQCPVPATNADGSPNPANQTGPGKPQVGEFWPNDDQGRLQGAMFGNTAFGLPATRPIVDGLGTQPLYDLMSYCPNQFPTGQTRDNVQWISARNWDRSIATIYGYRLLVRPAAAIARAPHPAAAAAGTGEGYVVGAIGPDGGRIDRVVPPDPASSTAVPALADSPTRVQAFDAAGNPIGDTGALVLRAADGPAGAGFFIAPVPAGAAAVELVRGGVVLDRKQRTAPPSVRLLWPRHRVRVAGRRAQLVVRWSASDPDGDPLYAKVAYSADDGRSWETVFEGPNTGTLSVPAGALAGSHSARIRVAVNDGFNEPRIESPIFRVVGAPPSVRIITPQLGEPETAGIQTLLVGSAIDTSGTSIPDGSLAWYAGRRRLGTGARLITVLQAGRYALRLVATDRAHVSGVAAVRMVVQPIALQLSALSYAPTVGRGVRSLRLTIATSIPAVLVVERRRYAVGRATRLLSIPLPRASRARVIRIPCRLVARDGQRVAGTLEVGRR
jgi:streptogramin lyase